MADSENTPAPPSGGVFVAHSEIMDSDGVRRALWRMAHEILEQNKGLTDVVLVSSPTRSTQTTAGPVSGCPRA